MNDVHKGIEADRDRLIHILVVHFDMFRGKAEDAADLFLHEKTLSTPPSQALNAGDGDAVKVYVKEADFTVVTSKRAAAQDLQSLLEQGWSVETEAHLMLAISALTLSAIPTETGKGEDGGPSLVTDEMVIRAMAEIPGGDHDDMVRALQAALGLEIER